MTVAATSIDEQHHTTATFETSTTTSTTAVTTATSTTTDPLSFATPILTSEDHHDDDARTSLLLASEQAGASPNDEYLYTRPDVDHNHDDAAAIDAIARDKGPLVVDLSLNSDIPEEAFDFSDGLDIAPPLTCTMRELLPEYWTITK